MFEINKYFFIIYFSFLCGPQQFVWLPCQEVDSGFGGSADQLVDSRFDFWGQFWQHFQCVKRLVQLGDVPGTDQGCGCVFVLYAPGEGDFDKG